MVSIGRINGTTSNINVQKVIITAKLIGAEYEVNENFGFNVDNRTPEYLAKFPMGQIPSFEGSDGFLMTESNAIVIHIAGLQSGAPLLGHKHTDKSKVLQYCFFAGNQISPFSSIISAPIMGYNTYNSEAESNAYKRLDRAYTYLNSEIGERKYLVGDSITAADVIVTTAIYYSFAIFYDEEDRKKYPHLHRWFKEMINVEQFKQVLGEVKFAQERLKLDSNIKPLFDLNRW